MIQVHQFCCPTATLNFLLSARSPPAYMQVNPRLHAFLFCWCQEASLLTEDGGPVLTIKHSHWGSPATPSNSRSLAPLLSDNLSLFGCQETCFFKASKGPELPTVPNHQESSCFSVKDRKMPDSPLRGTKL
jgi:hypothetical protein